MPSPCEKQRGPCDGAPHSDAKRDPSVLERQRSPSQPVTSVFAMAPNYDLNRDRKFDQLYVLGECIGIGGTSSVYTCHLASKPRKDEFRYAVRILRKNHVGLRPGRFRAEYDNYQSVDHDSLQPYLEAFEDETQMYFVMEYMTGGELLDNLTQAYPKGYPESVVVDVTRRVLEGLSHLHSKGYVHGNLKPQNLLCDKSGVVKIVDFGFTRLLKETMRVRTACSAPSYFAPEFLLSDMTASLSSGMDMWALGVVVYVLLCGFGPFFDESVPALFQSITTGHFTFPSPYWDCVSADAKDFVMRLLDVDLSTRMTQQSAQHHPFLQSHGKHILTGVTERLRLLKPSRHETLEVEENPGNALSAVNSGLAALHGNAGGSPAHVLDASMVSIH